MFLFKFVMKSLFSFTATMLPSDLQTSPPRHLGIPIHELRRAFTRIMKISYIHFMINEKLMSFFNLFFFCATPHADLFPQAMPSHGHAVFEHT